MRTRLDRSRAPRAWPTLAAGLALLAAGGACLTLATRQPADGPYAVIRPPGLAASPQPAARQVPLPAHPPATRAVHPDRLDIPAVDLSSPLTRLGLRPDGTVQVPADPALAGWFRHGPAPGSVGSSVILGHVDSVDGPAVFYRLKSVTRGDRVRVGLDNGDIATFIVTGVMTYEHADFPARLVYGSRGLRELKLVTCGGAYDAGAGGYQANVVVSSRWLHTTHGPVGRVPKA